MIIGKRISDRYKIMELIGGGGMSNVYLAHDMILNRDVAIKILRYDFTNEEELHRRFQREALSATSLTHSNIVSIYDVGEDGDMHYIVMEYIKGKTLKQYIQEFSPLSPARSVHIMKQLTSAIAHAHENGIIHRDIKPQNILMDLDGNVKVTDFGIATTLSATSYTQTNSVIGTVHYLSPEQARGGIATGKSDIYALGIVFYELLTGELPFSGESAVSIALKHLQAETPSVRAFDGSIPQSVENIVLKATAKDSNHRYRSAEEMEHDLETCLSADRIHEAKFTLPIDDDATKILPIIKDDKMPVHDIAETKKMEAKKHTPSQPEPLAPPKNKKWPIIVASIVLLAIIAVAAVYFMKPKKVEIPKEIIGMTLEEATQELKSLGFNIGEIEERDDEEIDEGNVIETSPRTGLLKVKGTEIKLIVSKGAATSKMANYVDQQLSQVSSLLGDFKDHKLEYENSDAEKGIIIRQDPAAGEDIIVKDTVVTLVISEGKKTVKLANLSNYSNSALEEYTQRHKLKWKIVDERTSETIPKGSVISHKPNAGEEVEEGKTIEVVISSGPPAKKTNFRSIEIEIPYEPIFNEEGEEEYREQTIHIYIQDKNNKMHELYDTLTITETTKYRMNFEIEEGSEAAYRIDRDSFKIADGTIPYSN
ncbi:Stk1 family PASTA domain-containing Ser/Thr kinase [Metasolibacillus meyeri]|uniref:Serine/threonine-protein kinase PrkC n=1 Tax=Metasolibacillus meyeri TaxID=1071052 RepID=A0AAW9NPD6_9BACL|nr:Stk1 family PASTA domain-containing Ser/Thr kinase [Metasolibacillus meyeri]MEC1179400.1 Stk1 family PASTA domain-containing Ser/Thr kinase [Metasolibacillus meyeri]